MKDKLEITEALRKAGWNFAVNDLNDTVVVNGELLNAWAMDEIQHYCREAGICRLSKGKLRDVLMAEANKNRYNPIKDYLSGLVWDGEDHISSLCDCFKSDDTLIRDWLTGAVSKVFDGYRNSVLILSGDGIGAWLCKDIPSYFIRRRLFGDVAYLNIFQAVKFIWEISEPDAADLRKSIARNAERNVSFRPPCCSHFIRKPSVASFVVTDAGACDAGRYSEILNPGQIWAQAVHLQSALSAD